MSDLRAQATIIAEAIAAFKPKDPRNVIAREKMLAAISEKRVDKAQAIYLRASKREINYLKARQAGVQSELVTLETLQAEYVGLNDWADSYPILESACGSLWHECENSGRLGFYSASYAERGGTADFSGIACYVMEHNWAGAFRNAKDFELGEYRLPHDLCCFEFQFTGKRLCVVARAEDGAPSTLVPYLQSSANWFQAATYTLRHGSWTSEFGEEDKLQPVVAAIGEQIRAACIGLEAEVIVSDLVRQSHKLNSARNKVGQPPIYDYRALSLASRRQSDKLQKLSEQEPGRVRMHFRRGHWRHFSNHKTWIKWMLVGNPDLGFADKHYRL